MRTKQWRLASIAAAGVTALLLAGCGSSGGSSAGGSTKGQTIRIAARPGDIGLMAPYLAQSLGYFKEQGVNAQFSNFNSGNLAVKALVAGKADVATSTYGGMLAANLQGAKLVQTLLLSPVPAEVLLVSTKYHGNATLKSLAGQTIGVSGLGTPPEYFARDVLASAGVSQSDVKLAAIANGAPAQNAILHNRIAALVQSEDPLVTELVSSGQAKILADSRTIAGTQSSLGGPYPGENLVASEATISKDSALIKKANVAILKALKWMQTHTPQEIVDQVPANPWYANDAAKATLVKSVAESTDLFKTDGTMTTEGAQNVQRNLALAAPTLGFDKLDLSTTYDNSLVPSS